MHGCSVQQRHFPKLPASNLIHMHSAYFTSGSFRPALTFFFFHLSADHELQHLKMGMDSLLAANDEKV